MSDCLFDRLFPPLRDARVAVLFEQREITYAELRTLTISTAEKLNALDLRRGDRVAILLNDSPEFIASLVAIISLGAIAVPINMALRQSDQLIILQDCGARVGIVENEAAPSLFCQKGEATTLEQLILVSREGQNQPPISPAIQIRQFEIAEQRPIQGNFPAALPLDGDAFILYTSGSTGEPKGAVHSQADIFYTNETFGRQVLRLREDDRLFSSSRLPFAYGLGNAFTFPLLNGLRSRSCIACCLSITGQALEYRLQSGLHLRKTQLKFLL
jgi:benzoate-CoA ligase